MAESSLHALESTVLTAIVVVYVLALVLRRLRRARPNFRAGQLVCLAFVVRIAAAAVVSLSSVASTLRGPDESTFMSQANDIVKAGLLSHHAFTMISSLHVMVFAVQKALLDSPDFALRITQVGLSVVGLAFMLAAVYDLA